MIKPSKKPILSAEDHKRLNDLSDNAKSLRLLYAKEAAVFNAERSRLAMMKADALRAREAHLEAYKAAGYNRQSEWQRYRESQGLCRICGEPAELQRTQCSSCREKQKAVIREAMKRKNG